MSAHTITMSNAVKFLANIKNRDAAFRFIQFANRLVLFSLAQAKDKKTVATREQLLVAQGALIGGRKLIAFGHELTEAWNVIRILSEKDALTTQKTLLALRSVAMFNFFILDHLVWLNKYAKLIAADPKRSGVLGARSAAVANVISLYLDGVAINKSLAVLAKPANEDEATAERRKLTEVSVRQLRNACDLLVNTAGGELVRVNEGFVAFCGSLSALLFCYEFWP